MEIKPLSSNIFLNKEVVQNKKGKEVENNPRAKDTLELSGAAAELKQTELETQKLEIIKKRIESKYYDSDEVIGKVAEAILKETLPQ